MAQAKSLSKARSVGVAALAAGGLVAAAAVVNLSQTDPAYSQGPAFAGPVSFADVIEDVSPAVVNITVSKVVETTPTQFRQRGFSAPEELPLPPGSPFEDFLERFFGPDGGGRFQFSVPYGQQQPFDQFTPRAQGQGSGFIVAADGYIVTNNHVVDGAERITVTLQDGDQLEATLVGTDPKTDVALIKVNETGLPFVRFGDSNAARVGDWVVAIGNPFGLGGTATAGIISARGRDIRSGPYDDYLQIDAPVNQGNSGGPVFNARGEVLGVNTAIYSPSGGNVGIAFAIPATQAEKVVAELREKGTVDRGWLGVSIQPIDEDLAAALELSDTKGALVGPNLPEGPAQRAGIQSGDIITRFDGKAVDSPRALSEMVAEADPNQRVAVTVLRNGETRNIDVELGRASTTEMAEAKDEPRAAPGLRAKDAGNAVGLAMRNLTDADRAQLGAQGVTGALVTGVMPNSPAAEKGLRPGDVIVQVDGKPVTSADAAVAALNAARASDGSAVLVVHRDGAQHYVGLKVSS